MSADEIEILTMLADINNSGTINYMEFSMLLSHRVIDPIEAEGQLDSSREDKCSMKYVITKCLEQKMDIYTLMCNIDPLKTGGI